MHQAEPFLTSMFSLFNWEMAHICGTQNFITLFTRTCYWSLSWARWIHCTSILYVANQLQYYPFSYIFVFQVVSFLQVCPPKTLYAFLFFSMCVCFMSSTSYLSLFNYYHNVLLRAQSVKLWVVSLMLMSFMLFHLIFLCCINKMPEACALYGVDKKCIQGFDEETWRRMTTWNTCKYVGG